MTTSSSPANRETRMQAINQTLERADWMGAAALAEAALQAGDQGPLLLKLRALRRQQARQWGLAAADIDGALAEWPLDASAWNMLGFCQARAGAPEAALASLDKALALAPDFAPAWVNRGWTLEMTGELKPAREAYEKALALDPDDARPASNLALLAARAADWSRARALASQVLSRDPGQSAASLALAMTELGEGDPAKALARLEEVAAQSAGDPHQQAVAKGLIGDALDRLDRPGEAFAAYLEANAGLAEAYGPALAGQERGAARADRLAEAFAKVPARDWRGSLAAAPRTGPAITGHVFLLGFPRSGTTLTGQILDAHPGVATLDERETLANAAAAYLEGDDGFARLAAATQAELAPLRGAYWARVARAGLALDGKVFVDKLPLNTLGLPLIARLFPQAKVVFLRRDPRDVVLSCLRQRFVVGPSTAEFLTLEGAARFFDGVMRLAETYFTNLDMPLRLQSYEALVENFDAETRALCAFIGLEWNDAMAGFAERIGAGAVATPSASQIARGLNREGIGQWRRYSRPMEPVMPVLRPWVAQFGYPSE